MLNPKVAVPMKTSIEVAAEKLASTITTIQKPKRLLLAERLTMSARQRMAERADELNAAIREFNRKPAADHKTPKHIADLQEEHKTAEATVVKQRAEMQAERDAWAPAFVEAHHKLATDVQGELLALVDQMVIGIEALRAARQFAAGNALPIVRALDNADYLRAAMNDIRRIIGG